MKRMMRVKLSLLVGTTAFWFGCGGNAPAAPPECDEACQDGIAIRALRVGMRYAHNLVIAGKPVGMQDVTAPCLPLGSAHIVGTAESNAMLGISTVDLTYTLTNCKIPSPDSPTAERNYDLTVNGVVNENGTLAMGGPTTALFFTGMMLSFSGTVHDPPIQYEATDCQLMANQDGNTITGALCGRTFKGFSGF